MEHASSRYGDYVDANDNVVVPNIDNEKDPKPPGTKYKGAPMPYFMRIVGGVGMHAGYLPGYPASHGCIRMPEFMAENFFNNVDLGTSGHDCALAPVWRSPQAQGCPGSRRDYTPALRDMIIITQPSVTDAQIDHIVARIEEFGFRSQIMRGDKRVVIGVIGSDELIREKPLAAIPGVESVVPVMKPYKLVAQENGALPPPVAIGGVKIGSGQRVALISGPCSVESKEQVLSIASLVKKAGARVSARRRLSSRALRPTASKVWAKMAFGFSPKRALKPVSPIITEIMDTRDLACSRNMPTASKSARATCRTSPCSRK